MVPSCDDEQHAPRNLRHLSLLSKVSEGRFRIATVVHHQTFQRAVAGAVADVERQAVIDLDEASGADDVCDEIYADLGQLLAKLGEACGRNPERGDERQDAEQAGEGHDRLENLRLGGAGGVDDDKLVVAVQRIQNDDQRYREGEGCDNHAEKGQGQHRHLEELDDGLALGCDQVELAQSLRCPHDADHRAECEQKGARDASQDIALDRLHHMSEGRPLPRPGECAMRGSFAPSGAAFPVAGPCFSHLPCAVNARLQIGAAQDRFPPASHCEQCPENLLRYGSPLPAITSMILGEDALKKQG